MQVLLQADTIRELTVTSDKLSKLENLEKALHGRAEKSEAELVCSLISAILLASFAHSRTVLFALCSLAITWTNPPLAQEGYCQASLLVCDSQCPQASQMYTEYILLLYLPIFFYPGLLLFLV